MKTCKTCKFWKELEIYSDYNSLYYKTEWYNDLSEIKNPYNKFQVKYCTIAKKNDYVNSNGFGAHDGSNYMAKVYTGENFGCILWEENK